MTAPAGLRPARAGPAIIPAWVFLVVALAGAAVTACLIAGVGPVAHTPAISAFQSLVVERTVLGPGYIELHLRNATARPVTVTQVAVDHAFWSHSMTPKTVRPRARATLVIDYPWEGGQASLAIPLSLLTATDAEVSHVITNPRATPPAIPRGGREVALAVGVAAAPVVVAMVALFLLSRSAARWSGGLVTGVALGVVVAFLASGAREAGRSARLVSPFIGGRLLVMLVAVSALSFTLWLRRVAAAPDGAFGRRSFAIVVAAGVGLYGLAEGLALGHSLATGALGLGGRQVLTHLALAAAGGLAIVASVASADPVRLPDRRRVLLLSLAAGVPMAAGLALGRAVGTATWSAAGVAAGVGALAVAAWSLAWRWLDEERGVVSSPAAAVVVGVFVATILAAVAA